MFISLRLGGVGTVLAVSMSACSATADGEIGPLLRPAQTSDGGPSAPSAPPPPSSAPPAPSSSASDAGPDAPLPIESSNIAIARNWGLTFGATVGLDAGAEVVVEVVVPPAHGSLSAVASSQVKHALAYRPEYFFTGDDTFEYRVRSGATELRHARVHATVDRSHWVDVGGQVKRVRVVPGSAAPETDELELRDTNGGRVLGLGWRGAASSSVEGPVDALSVVAVDGQSATSLQRFSAGGGLVGFVTDALGVTRGVLRTAGVDTIWSAPGATSTWLQGATTDGSVYGAASGVFGEGRRAIRAHLAGGAVTQLGPTDATASMAMGHAGSTVVGWFVGGGDGRRRAFVQDDVGVQTLATTSAAVETDADDVNASGDMVGSTVEPPGLRQPLVWRKRAPSAVRLLFSIEGALRGLDDDDVMVGWSREPRGRVQGILLDSAPAAPRGGFWMETDEPADSVLTHACGHGRSGPFLNIAAAPSALLAETPATTLARRHILYRSALPADGSAHRGYFRVQVTRDGPLSIHTGGLVAVRLLRDGAVVPISLGFRFRNCAYLRFVHEYGVTTGDYILEIGPSPLDRAEILLENEWAFEP